MNEPCESVSVWFIPKIIDIFIESVYNVLLCFYEFIFLVSDRLHGGFSIWFMLPHARGTSVMLVERVLDSLNFSSTKFLRNLQRNKQFSCFVLILL